VADRVSCGPGPPVAPAESIRHPRHHFRVWTATPLVALEVDEQAYFLDYQTDRAAYIDAFLRNLDWHVVNHWVEAYRIPME